MKKVKSITPAQKKVLDYIVQYSNKYGYSPTLHNIAIELSKSITTAQHYVNSLEKQGFIRKAKNKTRGIMPLSENDGQVMLLGFIAAGYPIEPIENPTPVRVPKELINKPGQFYALEVRGDSMIDDGIWDGDLIVIQHKFCANPNETIVAITEEGATLKVLKYDGSGQAYLQPRNSNYSKIYPLALEVRGTLVGVVHRAC